MIAESFRCALHSLYRQYSQVSLQTLEAGVHVESFQLKGGNYANMDGRDLGETGPIFIICLRALSPQDENNVHISPEKGQIEPVEAS